MPRQSRSRPAARPAAPAPSAQQSRGAHTAAAPSYGGSVPQNPSAAPPSAAQARSREPGLLTQMAATAGSVAVGSTIGHGLSNMLFGGSSHPPAPVAEAPPAPQNYQTSPLAVMFKLGVNFTRCLETNDASQCGWFLEKLKECQAVSRQY
ncbi:uncharacterized protein EI90DRAFT_3058143 [Cantharellus anzutake]|uniref:uncharacterized protein n=1 Tax=Cantharellus anzutake TaxID=1750568 RepID=UPI001907C540|nr:uncharacterized protein EI90DRAFT_3058143 [Cantharellus anzutake]KAF8331514.1 hypothetical protein EI90DRAFT_3058143 [Cantharellus anzutake]